MKLTNEDLNAIKNLIEITFDEKLDQKLEEKLDEKLKYIPTQEEFFNQMDKIMKELKDMREEMIVLSGTSSDHSDRLETLEKMHPGGVHATS